ncbi:hypothetical protein niasHT_031064 [Heterodera trifolii]|uniref:Uncharacterized protein n=1 Tax=Heterodera trifolii TaxID=157864 RepID=A0ABD2I6S3_9BILA
MDLREAGARYKFDVDQRLFKPIIPRIHINCSQFCSSEQMREKVRAYFSEHCDTISEVHECDLFFVQLNGGEGWFAEDDQIQWDFAILHFDDHVKKRHEFDRIIRWINSALKEIEENRVPASPTGPSDSDEGFD